MDSSEDSRHTGRKKLVESSTLKEEDFLWSPGNPLQWASRDWTSMSPDYYQNVAAGRSREWKRRYLAMNALLAVIVVAFLALFLWFGLYGPNIGLVSALAIFFAGIAVLGAAAFITGRTVVNLEYGFHRPRRDDRRSRKEE